MPRSSVPASGMNTGAAAHVSVATSSAYRPLGVVTYTVVPASFTAGCCTSRPLAPGAGDSNTGAAFHADVGVARVKSLRPTPQSATQMAVWFCSAMPCGAARPVKPRFVHVMDTCDGATPMVPATVASTVVPCVAYTLPSNGDTVTKRPPLPRVSEMAPLAGYAPGAATGPYGTVPNV